ncbi:hypothetical protein P9314_11520 [Paenibacillus validus]|uniref:hypothetical protein n=1 Tax=Paenibacillus validus TaxID=44253 RepID=UPI000FDB24A6|nr:hypothetical protein [Paenibacillus validus]MED4601332.1 hypothetical protein [Paenibacillus validus]MED4609570.1 hypothetical protein [Paenibacillus validus]
MRKRWIWMMTLLLPLTALAWAAFPHPCAACSCAAVTPLQAAEHAAAVFEGKVLGIRETYDPYDESGAIGRRYAVRLEVDSIRKGELPSEAIVYTGFHSCGIDFKQGETYLVYAQERHPGELETHLCAGTKALTDARDDLALLPVGVKPSTQADLSGSLMTEVPGWLALYAKQAWNKLTQPHALAKLGLLALGFAIACAFVATKRKRLPLYSLSRVIGLCGGVYSSALWISLIWLNPYAPLSNPSEWLAVLLFGLAPALLAIVSSVRRRPWGMLAALLWAAPLSLYVAATPGVFRWAGVALPFYMLAWLMMKLHKDSSAR